MPGEPRCLDCEKRVLVGHLGAWQKGERTHPVRLAIEAEAASPQPDAPEREGLRALDAEIARRRSPDYQWFPKPHAGQTPDGRAGAAGARAMQHGELTGLVIARAIISRAAPTASPDSLDAAWAEAEAASLGSGMSSGGWVVVAIERTPNEPVEYRAIEQSGQPHEYGPWAPTPAAALHALAERLRAKAGSAAEIEEK